MLFLWCFASLLLFHQAEDEVGYEFGVDDTCDGSDDCGLSLRQLRGEKQVSMLGLATDQSSSVLDDESLDGYLLNSNNLASNLSTDKDEPPVHTFYVYRAKDNETYEDTNVNMANLPGVLWYLHNEVVGHCPRKFSVIRILRYKITMRATPELYRTGKEFASLCHFDAAQCTGPENSLQEYQRFGYVVGCDRPSFQQASYPQATWYSFPGQCPQASQPIQPKADFNHKSRCAFGANAGGLCRDGQEWSNTCTWRREPAGEISLDELTRNRDFETRCKTKNFQEYNEACDCGGGTNFWHGKRNYKVAGRRMAWLKKVFAMKFPGMPADLEPEPVCAYGDPKR